jgi:hypothetical protein
MYECELCGKDIQMGPHRYEGKMLSGYRLQVCVSGCYEGNLDGWTQHYEAKLLARLKELGIEPPPLNAKGWLPREF